MKKVFITIIVGIMLGGTACGPTGQFSKARKLERKGRYEEAWDLYQSLAANYPKHKLAPAALFRAGWVAQVGLKDCYMANTFYERVVAEYPQSAPWARAAALAPLNCPDYFPLIPGCQWEEGDSETKGSIARTVIHCKPLSFNKDTLPSQMAVLERIYYAGQKKSLTSAYVYRKDSNELLEFISETDPRAKVLMKWPLEEGMRWKTRMGGRIFAYEVISTHETVKVAAGEFESCVKIREEIEGSPGSRNFYYAPGVGRVLLTQGTRSGEERHTELLSFKIAETPEVEKKEETK